MSLPALDDLRVDSGVAKLNTYLSSRSYITGYTPSQDDCIVLSKLSLHPNPDKYPHVYRWYKHIFSFNTQERETWPKGTLKDTCSKQKNNAAADDIDLFGDDDDAEAMEKLKAKKKEETAGKKKKEVINKSSLVIEIKPASSEVDLDLLERLTKEIKIEGLSWGETVKRVPIAYGIYKLQLSCVIIDDLVNTNDITDEIEGLGMSEKEKERLRKRQQEGCDEETDEDSDEGLVQSVEIVSFNKL